MARYFVWAAVVVAGALLAVADWRWIKRPVFGALLVAGVLGGAIVINVSPFTFGTGGYYMEGVIISAGSALAWLVMFSLSPGNLPLGVSVVTVPDDLVEVGDGIASAIPTWLLCVVASVYRGKTHINDVALARRSRQAERSIVSEIQRGAAARQSQRR
jgi:hypothetical protein